MLNNRIYSLLIAFLAFTIPAIGQETLPSSTDALLGDRKENKGGGVNEIIISINELNSSRINNLHNIVSAFSILDDECDYVASENEKKKTTCQKLFGLLDNAIINELHYDKKRSELLITYDELLIINKKSLSENLDVNSAENLYKAWVFEHSKSVFKSHREKSDLIFFFVISLCIVGVLFSSVHFFIDVRKNISRKLEYPVDGHKNPITKDTDGEKIENNKNEHKAKLSMSGLELNSSAIGLTIFFITIAFFYLYLSYVYPIK